MAKFGTLLAALLVGCVGFEDKGSVSQGLSEADCVNECAAKGASVDTCAEYCSKTGGDCISAKTAYCVDEMGLDEAVCRKKASAWCDDEADEK